MMSSIEQAFINCPIQSTFLSYNTGIAIAVSFLYFDEKMYPYSCQTTGK